MKRGKKHARVKQWQQASAKYRQTDRGRFLRSKDNAAKRGLRWSLSFEQWTEVAKQDCHYCGREPKGQTGSWCDRLDNKQGYAYANVVPCCGSCNKTRGDRFTPEEMTLFLGPALRAVREARDGKGIRPFGNGGPLVRVGSGRPPV